MIWQQVTRAVKMFTPCGNNLNGGNIFFFSGRKKKKGAHKSIVLHSE